MASRHVAPLYKKRLRYRLLHKACALLAIIARERGQVAPNFWKNYVDRVILGPKRKLRVTRVPNTKQMEAT